MSIVSNDYKNYTDEMWNHSMPQSFESPSEYTFKKNILYIASLYLNHIKSCFYAFMNYTGISSQARWSWWNEVTQNHSSNAKLYLGAIPLKREFLSHVTSDDADSIKKLGVDAILSVTEPFENNAGGLFLSAVTPAEWKSKDVCQLQLPTPDFQTIDLEKIHKGVEFIRWNLNSGRSVYVHCKAGRGRSALIVLCYLIKYRQMSAKEAVNSLQLDRKQICVTGAKKEATIKAYKRSIRQMELQELEGNYYQDPEALLKKAWDALVHIASCLHIQLNHRSDVDNTSGSHTELNAAIQKYKALEKRRDHLVQKALGISGAS